MRRRPRTEPRRLSFAAHGKARRHFRASSSHAGTAPLSHSWALSPAAIPPMRRTTRQPGIRPHDDHDSGPPASTRPPPDATNAPGRRLLAGSTDQPMRGTDQPMRGKVRHGTVSSSSGGSLHFPHEEVPHEQAGPLLCSHPAPAQPAPTLAPGRAAQTRAGHRPSEDAQPTVFTLPADRFPICQARERRSQPAGLGP